MKIPDRWAVIKFDNSIITYYRLLGSWYGGYASGDSWHLNSGINEIKEHIDKDGYEYYDFIGFSGSVYRCYKGNEGMSGTAAGVFQNLVEKGRAKQLVVSFVSDFDTEKFKLMDK